jgi:NADH dehydrogenase
MKVVIVGGGFGGIKTALELANVAGFEVTLISDKENFQYYPTLYSTATGSSHKETWVPMDTILEGKDNVTFVQDTILSMNPQAKNITGKSGTVYSYNRLVLALGSVTTYFGIEGLDQYAYGIKSEDEIRRLQKHLLEEVRDESITDKHYVVIGAGPTGVELASALGEYIKKIHKHLNIPLEDKSVNIDLVEAAPRVLPRMSEASSKKAEERLRKLGVNVMLDKKVESETAGALMVSGQPLKSHTVIWTSGVANAPFFKENAQHFNLDQRGKVVVDNHMNACDGVYVIGDNAATQYAGLAQTALHDAMFVARNLKREANGHSLRSYTSVMPASVVPIGKNWAVFEWGKVRFTGPLAMLMREFADIIGYHDLLPIGQAIGVWKAGSKAELQIPETIGN